MDARIVLAILACVSSTYSTAALSSAEHSGMPPAHPIPSAYMAAARAAGIPPTLFWVIALQESGVLRRHREVPWPWTLNVAGVPMRFPTRRSACTALNEALRRSSAKRVDVGLVQVNWGYHRELLHSPCDLLDPYRNLEVGSKLLLELHKDGESWMMTAARYHRPAGGAEAAQYADALRLRLARLQRAAFRP